MPRWAGVASRHPARHRTKRLFAFGYPLAPAEDSPVVLHSLPREKQAYFRQPWIADFRTSPATHNTTERFLDNDEAPVDTDHKP